jgi:teichoic acid transport system permease protein
VTKLIAPPAPARGAAAIPEGMHRTGARPPLRRYLAQLWERRHFIISYTRANNEVMYSRSFLGQLWQVLTPLLNAGVYYLIFGLLLHTSRGVHNFIAFLVIGIFVFHFLQQTIIRGARSIIGNQGLIRSVHFPRASLPLSTTGQTFIQLIVSLVVMVPIVLLTGESPDWGWFLLLPDVALAAVFAAGTALVIARISARIPDTTALLPFVLRTWLYFSGIFYSVEAFTKHRHWLRVVLELNPAVTYVDLARAALLDEHTVPGYLWGFAVGWAVALAIFGTLFFWAGEETYARG